MIDKYSVSLALYAGNLPVTGKNGFICVCAFLTLFTTYAIEDTVETLYNTINFC